MSEAKTDWKAIAESAKGGIEDLQELERLALSGSDVEPLVAAYPTERILGLVADCEVELAAITEKLS